MRLGGALAFALLLPGPLLFLQRPLLSPPSARAGDAPGADRLEGFRQATRSGTFAERLRAFDALVDEADVRTVDAILWAGLLYGRERAALAQRLAKDEAADRETAGDLDRIEHDYEKLGSVSTAQYERYRRERARLEEARRALSASIDAARIEAGRLVRLLDRTRDALTTALSRVADDQRAVALDRARAGWLRGSGAGFEAKRRFLEAIAWVRRPGFDEAIAALVADPLEDVRIRGAALTLRAERRGDGTLEMATAMLAAPSWILQASAIEALRVLHDVTSIDPLIAYLARTDLGRLREDARRALCSLTGEAHGPYQEAWAAWWKEARREFEMPKKPAKVPPPGGADAGATFYGITTFSRHVLFAIDVSGSMAGPDVAARGGESKLDVARRELFTALDTLDDGGTFGVLLFNGRVTAMPGGVTRTDAGARSRARTFVAGVEPAGPTNVIDALEEALRLAGASGDEPVAAVDTIFFLTDGRPTAGAVVDPASILERVTRLHGAAPVVIHAVGIGEHDADLLRRLAELTGGRYVTR